MTIYLTNRKPVNGLIVDDYEIFRALIARNPWLIQSAEADRRDAEIMFALVDTSHDEKLAAQAARGSDTLDKKETPHRSGGRGN